jgi:hypothetical protein
VSSAETAKPANSLLEFLSNPDQERIRRELATFFGPDSDYFLETYEKMRNGPKGPRLYARTWCWPAFLTTFVWCFYRKRYVEGAAIILVPILAKILFGFGAVGAVWGVMATHAKPLYVLSGLRRIVKADELGLSGDERLDYLQRAGGVSLAGGAIGGFIYSGLLALVIFAAAAGRHPR